MKGGIPNKNEHGSLEIDATGFATVKQEIL